MNELIDSIHDLGGCKIQNTHFRIGSKLHISDFYYAKRLFQNGFFASRIAFLLTRDIQIRINENELNAIKENGLTIIGYEMYSELLINMINKFLKKKWRLPDSKINHNIFENEGELRLCKKSKILGNIILIIPIASTFSTAIKIEKCILDLFRNRNILQPYYNVVFVCDETPDKQISSIISETEKLFGWEKKNPVMKSIQVNAYYSQNKESRENKYYLPLHTKWHLVERCKLCMPDDPSTEIPLYETDRTNVTPAIIFDYPKGRDIDKEDLNRKYTLDKEAVIYGHNKRNETHFLYAIDTEMFLEKNIKAVKEWLINISRKSEFIQIYDEKKKVILISSCHSTNSGFLTLVNDFLFSSAANIIHYDPSNDYVQNFDKIYGEDIYNANLIFFVDDSLKSGSTFDKIYHFVLNSIENSRKRKNVSLSTEPNILKGIAGCFFLINKTQYDMFEDLKKKVTNQDCIFAFANLHLFTTLKPYEPSLLLIEQKRYESLYANSFVESLKKHFAEQANKLSLERNRIHYTENINYSDREITEKKSIRHLNMLIATHRIYQYFTQVKVPVLNSFYDFINDLYACTKSPNEVVSNVTPIVNLNDDTTASYLKVLTQSPFTQYKPLRDEVFKWCLTLLEIHIRDIKNSIDAKEEITYEQFDTLKFLIRRAGLLNSNYLLSVQFLQFLKDYLYSEQGIHRLIRIHKDTYKEKKLKEFPIFYIAQIKELVFRNESRCIVLEKNISKIDKTSDPNMKQIIRILREENALILKNFYEYVSNQKGWKELYYEKQNINESSTFSTKETEDKKINKEDLFTAAQKQQEKKEIRQKKISQYIDSTTEKIKKFLLKETISKHLRYSTIEYFFKITGQNCIKDNKQLLNYLWLSYFLQYDKQKEINLNLKTEYIMTRLMEMFNNEGIKEVGSFFIVNTSRQKPFIAFNKNIKLRTDISSESWREVLDENSKRYHYIKDFLWEGTNNKEFVPEVNSEQYIYPNTVVELQKTSEGKWIDSFSSDLVPKTIELPETLFPEGYDRILLIKICRQKISGRSKKTHQGIIGFYYKQKENETVHINMIRYLLLLRSALSDFIARHHEADDFTDWQIAEIKQRTSLLTGHGREMLMNIATNSDEYKDIISTLLIVQRSIIDSEEESLISGEQNGSINQLFMRYFDYTVDKITSESIKCLKSMVKYIFLSEEIENKEDIEDEDIVISGESLLTTSPFSFNNKLLRMICFELFINAKKNRWIFAKETINVNEEKYTRNKIWIEVSNVLQNNGETKELSLTITNTCPMIQTEDFRILKQRKNLKEEESSSGIYLIHTMLDSFNLGSISFRQEKIKNKFGKFSVILNLKSIESE